jgi:CBS domain-containing protein
MTVGELLKIKGFSAITIRPDATIAEAALRLRQEKIGALVVSNDGATVEGIISERDIAFGLAEHLGSLHTLSVSQLMSKNVMTCKPDDSVREASRIMSWKGFRHLPVVEKGKLVGIISIRDILRNRITDLERISSMLRDCISATE